MALANYNHVLFIYLCNQHSQYACWMSEIILDIIQARAGFMLMCMCDFFLGRQRKRGRKRRKKLFCMFTILHYVGQIPWETESEILRPSCECSLKVLLDNL